MALFDHPQLCFPNGRSGNEVSVAEDGTGNAADGLMEVPAFGASGGVPLATLSR